jgi:hypothetical protein
MGRLTRHHRDRCHHHPRGCYRCFSQPAGQALTFEILASSSAAVARAS